MRSTSSRRWSSSRGAASSRFARRGSRAAGVSGCRCAERSGTTSAACGCFCSRLCRCIEMADEHMDTVERWAGGTYPFIAGWRKVMMWWFIVTDGLLFAGFLAAYGYARVLAFHWPQQSDVFSLKYIAAMTFVLITSSATMASAVKDARDGKRNAALKFVLLTAVGGLAFLGMQAYEWTHLIREGASLTSNPWGDPSFG